MLKPFKLIDSFKDQLVSDSLFVEIGSARDGGSTYFLYDLANSTGNEFVTIDVDPIFLNPKIKSETMDGAVWAKNKLPEYNRKIGLLFLDSYDWVDNPTAVRLGTARQEIANLVIDYESKGSILNNLNTSVALTTQARAMVPFMDTKCLVMLGDTWFNSTFDIFCGKGAGAAYLLLSEGFKIISASADSQHLILGRNIQELPLMPNVDITILSKKYSGPKKRNIDLVYKVI